MKARELLRLAPVMPVIVVPDAGLAVDMARALVDGGLPVLEITLRTPAAFEAMRRIRDAVPGAVVGAGTVLDRAQWQRAVDSGAVFGVSPGLTPELASAARAGGLPFLPGVATASEAMRAADEGFDTLKLFPAEAVGGRALLRSLHGPLPHLQFCPTGGIHAGNAAEYLALPNVGCVGGSWITPEALVAARDWDRVRELAAQAAALRPGASAR
ncbi:bifunctional 4-hydroxy-2-oxoglutarate aldolase/2-dehydro-3-deoxy-phosphogluconate aldolase [Thiomonas sp. FB-6]|uniref:bifunctional 4-hydroxy-2-oxoglutarate aldolase/2-dehydro-3-deoxy-phosphogluconate aldolase n=1 Tax=Thiomonas sp. FB-6 TaxID=1158291 RepID=UPI00037CA707|nr:bifunctional 4-hydroxy-2-oxoglutarate aldolase/2-dehydro-3-deoxy-phosphogluconate aldolase [Thiomonas sp. FB-6]